jgi:hypothetical protein
MTESDDLGASFACTAQVGDGGSDQEMQMAGALGAVGPLHAGPGGCNEGFLRDDALLVLVVITDEDDGNPSPGSPGDPPDWFADLVAAKLGIESNIVLLSLVGQNDQPDIGGTGCVRGERLMELTDMFTYGFVGDVCLPGYDAFFADAVGHIDDACETFTPAG